MRTLRYLLVQCVYISTSHQFDENDHSTTIFSPEFIFFIHFVETETQRNEKHTAIVAQPSAV